MSEAKRWALELSQDLQVALRRAEVDKVTQVLVEEICGKWVHAEQKEAER
jgi:hypothetical protein